MPECGLSKMGNWRKNKEQKGATLTILAAWPWSFWPADSSRARAFIRLQYTRASRQVSWSEEGMISLVGEGARRGR